MDVLTSLDLVEITGCFFSSNSVIHQQSKEFHIEKKVATLFLVLLTEITFSGPTSQRKINYSREAKLSSVANCSVSTHGILLGPATSHELVLAPVILVHVSDFRDQRVIRVGISEQRAY